MGSCITWELSAVVLCDKVEGWDGVGVEGGSRGRGHMYTYI